MFQQVTLLGNIGSDGEFKYMGDGTPLMNFSLATNRRTKDSDITTWWRITVWGKLAETFNELGFIQKGRRVQVVGEMICDKITGGPRVYLHEKSGERPHHFFDELPSNSRIFEVYSCRARIVS